MASGQIVITQDLGKMVDELGHEAAQKTAVFIRAFAREIVRKRSFALMNSIRTNEIAEGEFETLAGGPGIPYALAQEYGRPDLANYGFTPYMRPAAAISERSPETRDNILKATRKAIRASKVNRTKRF